MPIQFVSGDLFVNRFSAQAFAHGCNCQGSMGAGIATGFRDRYPAMYQEYRRRCKATPREFDLGDAWLWKAEDKPWVFNLGTQEGVWRARASYEAIETALGRMCRQADLEAVSRIAIPRIGVGYGGLSWRKVRAIVEQVFADWEGTLIVYEEFVPEESEPAKISLDKPGVQIHVESRRKKLAGLQKTWPNALILDVTSKGEEPWIRFSPFYPHGGIPVPGLAETFAQSVEGLWQGLKVFENEDVDASRFRITTMKNIKRPAGGKRGKVLGHRFGDALLNYLDARIRIYLPAYRWVLENRLTEQISKLRKDAADRPIVLLDYETNAGIEDLSSPLSHAALVKYYLEDAWPTVNPSGK